MREETRRKIYRAIARADAFIMTIATSLMCFGATILLAIAGLLEWRESKTGVVLLWALGGVAAAAGAIEWRHTGGSDDE